MLKIGLTGGIGSGKSAVATIFKLLGIPVFDADMEAKRIMEQDAGLVQSIINTFGVESYLAGKLNRAYLSNLVFKDSYKLDQLNALVHPVTIAAANKWMKQQTTPYVIKEAALMFESGSAGQLDYVIGVSAPIHLRIKRVMDRDGSTRDEVLARMNRQIDNKIKMMLCDFVITNDEQTLVIPQVLVLHEKFLKVGAVVN